MVVAIKMAVELIVVLSVLFNVVEVVAVEGEVPLSVINDTKKELPFIVII